MDHSESLLANIDPVPVSVAGIYTYLCECGWEAVFIVPEESQRLWLNVFNHFRDKHGINFPNVTVTQH